MHRGSVGGVGPARYVVRVRMELALSVGVHPGQRAGMTGRRAPAASGILRRILLRCFLDGLVRGAVWLRRVGRIRLGRIRCNWCNRLRRFGCRGRCHRGYCRRGHGCIGSHRRGRCARCGRRISGGRRISAHRCRGIAGRRISIGGCCRRLRRLLRRTI